MMVVKFTHCSSIIHQILSYSHFSSSRLNLYLKIDVKKQTNMHQKVIFIKLRVSKVTNQELYSY